jgi:hypothetical protein
VGNFALSVSDGWYRMGPLSGNAADATFAWIGSSREDKVMKVEIEYCGQ